MSTFQRNLTHLQLYITLKLDIFALSWYFETQYDMQWLDWTDTLRETAHSQGNNL